MQFDKIKDKKDFKVRINKVKEMVKNSEFKNTQDVGIFPNKNNPYEVFCTEVQCEFYKIHRNLVYFENSIAKDIMINFMINVDYYWEYVDNKISFDRLWTTLMQDKNNMLSNNKIKDKNNYIFFKMGIEYDVIYTFTNKKCYDSFINLTKKFPCFNLNKKYNNFDEYKFLFINNQISFKLFNDSENFCIKIIPVNLNNSDEKMIEDIYFKIEDGIVISTNIHYEA